MKVYVSSTYSDLVPFREQVYDVLRKQRYDVIAMEDYVASDERPLDKCVQDVAACDVYVGIFAWRYGYVPPGQERSITELEYEAATSNGVPRLIFLLKEDTPWPPNQIERGAGEARIKALKARLGTDHIVGFFSNPTELAMLVATATPPIAQKKLEASLDEFRTTREETARAEGDEAQRVVNAPPVVVAKLHDRVAERSDLAGHLRDPGVRVTSVLGRSGMGKSALVTTVIEEQIAATATDGGAQGHADESVLWLSSRTTGLTLERIVADMGRLLGAQAGKTLAASWARDGAGTEAKCRTLLAQLKDTRSIVVLDGLEEVLEGDGRIGQEGLRTFVDVCLSERRGPRLVLVSRAQALLPPSALASARTLRLDQGLPEHDAVALLRDLDPQESLGLAQAEASDLRRAAQATRGIPRALEILAGILHSDATASLADLVGGDLQGMTAETLVEEGHRRLDDDARRVLEALAVLQRPAKRAAIEFLVHPWFPGLDVRACINRLVRSIFVSANRATGELSLQPLDLECAYENIPTDADGPAGEPGWARAALELRAADFHDSTRLPADQWRTIHDLAPQLAEFDHCLRGGAAERAARVLELIEDDHLFLWGYYEILIDMRSRLLAADVPDALQASNRGHLALTCQVLGRFKEAKEHYEAAIQLARAAGDRAAEGRWLGDLGRHYRNQGWMEPALANSEEALEVAIASGDSRNAGFRHDRLGLVLRGLGRLDEARRAHRRAFAIGLELDEQRDMGASLSNLGWIEHLLGALDLASAHYDRALQIDTDIQDLRGVAIIRNRIGWVALARGEMDAARQEFEASLKTSRRLHLKHEQSESLLGLGCVALRSAGGDAVEPLQEAWAIDHPFTAYRVGVALGAALRARGDAVAARRVYAEARARSKARFDRSAGLFEARYVYAAALAGLAALDASTAGAVAPDVLAPVVEAYRDALKACGARGVVEAALADLALVIPVADGWEPVFGLLRAHLDGLQPHASKAVFVDFGNTLVVQQVDDKLPASKLNLKAFPDAAGFLADASAAGYTIAIVSNTTQSDHVDVGKALSDLDLLPFIDVVITSVDVGVEKPDPAMFERALQATGCAPADAVMIGDDLAKDVIAGAACGLRTVLLDRRGEHDGATDPDLRVRSLSEVVGWLEQRPA